MSDEVTRVTKVRPAGERILHICFAAIGATISLT